MDAGCVPAVAGVSVIVVSGAVAMHPGHVESLFVVAATVVTPDGEPVVVATVVVVSGSVAMSAVSVKPSSVVTLRVETFVVELAAVAMEPDRIEPVFVVSGLPTKPTPVGVSLDDVAAGIKRPITMSRPFTVFSMYAY